MYQWHEPSTSLIHLKNGQVIEAEVNGLDSENMSGSVFAQGRAIEVVRIADTNEWAEEYANIR